MPQPSSTIVEPRLACRSGNKADPIECSLHTLPKPLVREFQHIFAEKYLQGTTENNNMEILAIPTNQHARHDLVAVGEHIEAEKDRLLNCVRLLKKLDGCVFFSEHCHRFLERLSRTRLTEIFAFFFRFSF